MKSTIQLHNKRPAMKVAAKVAITTIISLSIASSFAQSGNHGDGHEQMHDIYKDWSQPDNPHVSCCNDKDCRPTRAYLTDEGWRAWNGRAWLLIPPNRVLPTDHAGDGRSHLCEMDGHVYCFSPGQVRG